MKGGGSGAAVNIPAKPATNITIATDSDASVIITIFLIFLFCYSACVILKDLTIDSNTGMYLSKTNGCPVSRRE